MRAHLMIMIIAAVNLSGAATAFAGNAHYAPEPAGNQPVQSNAPVRSSRTYALDRMFSGPNTLLPSTQSPQHEAPARLPNDFNWLAGGGG